MLYDSFPFALLYNNFTRPFQEVRGWNYVMGEDDNSATIYVNALGVDEKDISVDYKQGSTPNSVVFSIKGETKVGEMKAFRVNFSVEVSRKVKTLKKIFKNGLVILELGFDKPSSLEIEILE